MFHRGVPGLGGVPVPGGCLLWGGACSRGSGLKGCACSQGGGVVPAPGGKGSGLRGCLVETPQMATAVGSMHPTGMHSCCY